MKTKLKKAFFYILVTCIWFFNFVLTKAAVILWEDRVNVAVLYWIQEPEIDKKLKITYFILTFSSFILSPIIFLIGLYYLINKKFNGKKKKIWIIFLVISLLTFIITFFWLYAMGELVDIDSFRIF